METHSSILAWRIPWTEEHGRLQSTALHNQIQLKQLSIQHTLHVWFCIGELNQAQIVYCRTYLLREKCANKWTLTVPIHIVQGSTIILTSNSVQFSSIQSLSCV